MTEKSRNNQSIFELVVAVVLTVLMTLSMFNMLSSQNNNRMDNSIGEIQTERVEPGELP